MISPLDINGIFGLPTKGIRKEIISKHRRWFQHAHAVNHAMHHLLSLMRPHQFIAQEILVTVLFVRALTQYQSSLLLAMNGLPNECKIILRALIEIVIYLRAIHADPKYAEEYVRNHDRERIRLLKLIKRSPYLSNSVDIEEIEGQKDKVIDSLKDNKAGFSIEEYAIVADMLHIYHTAYKVFSGTVHSGIHDLQIHLNGTSPETVTEIRYGMSDEEIDNVLLVATEMMLLCVDPITARFSLPVIDEITEVFKQHKLLETDPTEQGVAGYPPQGVGSPER